MTETRRVAWGLCPTCLCGGTERPCWQCGFDGPGFAGGVNHITQVPNMSGWFGGAVA